MRKILSLGGGVQSSTLLLMCMAGEIEAPELAIFTDTQYEPAATYKYMEWLKSFSTIPIITLTKGDIRHDALHSVKRFANLPLFVRNKEGKASMLQRQCTGEYKISVINKYIRSEFKASLKNPVEVMVGISYDEIQRMKDSMVRYVVKSHPLIDNRITRFKCIEWNKSKGYPIPPKSSCLFCPFHDDDFWRKLKNESPEEFEDVCKFDDDIRWRLSRFKIKTAAYLHRSLKPLREIDFRNMEDLGQLNIFDFAGAECGGSCGL